MNKYIKFFTVAALLSLTGCDDPTLTQTEKTLRERFPDKRATRIMTDEAGNRYVVHRNESYFDYFEVIPCDAKTIK